MQKKIKLILTMDLIFIYLCVSIFIITDTWR